MNKDTGKKVSIYALEDGGADRDFLSAKVVEKLGIKTGEELTTVVDLRGPETKWRKNASFTVESLDGEYSCDIDRALVGELSVTGNDVPPAKRDLSKYRHLDGIEFADIDSEVEMVLSVAHVYTLFGKEMRTGRTSEPLAVKSDFGWTVMGVVGKTDSNDAVINLIAAERCDLKQKLDDIFHHDFGVEKCEMSKEQSDAKKQLDDSVFFDVEKGMYGCALPFRGGREEAIKKLNAHNSRGMAAKRLESLRRSLMRDPEKKKKVFEEVRKYIEQGKLEVVTDDDNDDANANDPRWTVPLHFVFQKGKTRLIHDCRACVDGFCINDVLLGIMDYLTPMKRPLRNWRKYPFVMTYDIIGFFYRVLLHEWDRNAFRCYFFADETMKRKMLLRTLSQPFGGASSPNICGFILRYHAEKMRPEFGDRIADAIRDDFYVDDGVGGADSEEEYREFKVGIEEAMKRGGFGLDKWAFSHPQLVGQPETKEEDRMTNILGLAWDKIDDTMSIKYDPEDYGEVKTMRQLVGVASKPFDPEGFMIPDGVEIRAVVQVGMHREGGWRWDELLEEETIERYEVWRARRKEMAMVKIPRCYNDADTVGIIADIHFFGDANPFKYGVAAYRVVTGRSGRIKVSYVNGRGHVVPKKSKKANHNGEMPLLELVAARKILDVIKETLDLKVEEYGRIVCWSDSESVLKWIFKPWGLKNDFLGNRIRKIQQETEPEQWRYVPRDINPADIITKGFPPGKPEVITKFHQGPDFLRKPESEWPKMTVNRYPKRPEPFVVCAAAVEPPTKGQGVLWLASLRDEWKKKKRLVAEMEWVVRKGKKSEVVKGKKRVSKDDLEEAEKSIIMAIQEKAFGEDKKELMAKGIASPVSKAELAKSFKISRLNPFVDAEGFIRVGSRLVHADISDAQKFPIVLPGDDKNVRSLIQMYHAEEMHAGHLHTHNVIRGKFWVLQGPVTVKKVVRVCPACQKAVKAPETQKMAPLPADRVTSGHPWQVTGVDMMGHFDIKKKGSRARHKAYIALFTCFKTRAIHMEVVESMNADSFMLALQRFCARRPGLQKLVSDNGSNFVGAKNIIIKETNEVQEIDRRTRRQVKELSAVCHNSDRKVASNTMLDISEKARPRLLNMGLEWEFLPPYASHYAGVWERLVGLVKKHLVKVLTGDTIHLETFTTVVTRVEAAVNRRPLTTMSTDPRDDSALTPENFLVPAAAGIVTADITSETEPSKADELRHHFKHSDSLLDSFWKKWQKDYINTLANRSKWTRTTTNLAVDDVVLIVDQSLKRKLWEMGRIVGVDHAEEHVRKVDIRREDGSVIKRDRTGVVKLELQED